MPGPLRIDKNAATLSQLGVCDWLVEQCHELGINQPTAVQCACIPEALSGRDIIGAAQTGTGKTAAFAIPILQRLSDDPSGVFALVLTPTRELAYQIADQFRVLGRPIGAKVSVIVGGRDMVAQAIELDRRPHIVIATPGRLHDHFKSGHSKAPFSRIQTLVFDEADRLLDGQYTEHLQTVLGVLPRKRQTLLFSATITDALTKLRDAGITGNEKPPFFWQQAFDIATVSTLTQHYVLCPGDVRDAYLVYVVKRFVESNPSSSVLIFARTCRECQALSMMLSTLSFNCGPLHSMIPMNERLRSLARFRSGQLKIMLCTDVAARGLDIPVVDLVVNADVPSCPKDYVHRVGRAARAGRSGAAITCMTPGDVARLHAVESLIGTQLETMTVSDRKVSKYVTEVLVAKREAHLKLDEGRFEEKRDANNIKRLILDGTDPEEARKMVEERRKYQREIEKKKNGAPSASDSREKRSKKSKKKMPMTKMETKRRKVKR